MEPSSNDVTGRTSATNLDEGISRLDKTLKKIYLPEIMAARRVIHSRMRRKRERQLQGGRGGGPTLYEFIMESRRQKMGSQVGTEPEHVLEDVAEAEEKQEHKPPTRQDSVFQSVDLSEIAGLREDPNRTPTPQPTFTDGSSEEHQVVEKSEAVAALSNIDQQSQSRSSSEAVAALSNINEQSQSRSSSGQSSGKSDGHLHEHYELQVRPGYTDADQIAMATTAYQSKERAGIERSSSLQEQHHEYQSSGREKSTVSDPGDAKERSIKKKRQPRQANDLDLAQKIILKRKVEEYIDRQEPEMSIEEVHESKETIQESSSETNDSVWYEEKESIQTESNIQEIKRTDRESVQTVMSSNSDSSNGETLKEVNHHVVSDTGSSEQSDSKSPSKDRRASSELNPHPVLPPINTPPATESPEESDETKDFDETTTGEAVEPVIIATTAAAGTGAVAAAALKVNNAAKQTTIEEKKEEMHHIAKVSKPTEKSEAGVEKSAPSVSKAPESKTTPNETINDKQTKPNKTAQPKTKKALSLKTITANDMKSTIDALEEIVDANIKTVIDNTEGNKQMSNPSKKDRRMVKAVMDPKFQAEINDFLAKT